MAGEGSLGRLCALRGGGQLDGHGGGLPRRLPQLRLQPPARCPRLRRLLRLCPQHLGSWRRLQRQRRGGGLGLGGLAGGLGGLHALVRPLGQLLDPGRHRAVEESAHAAAPLAAALAGALAGAPIAPPSGGGRLDLDEELGEALEGAAAALLLEARAQRIRLLLARPRALLRSLQLRLRRIASVGRLAQRLAQGGRLVLVVGGEGLEGEPRVGRRRTGCGSLARRLVQRRLHGAGARPGLLERLLQCTLAGLAGGTDLGQLGAKPRVRGGLDLEQLRLRPKLRECPRVQRQLVLQHKAGVARC